MDRALELDQNYLYPAKLIETRNAYVNDGYTITPNVIDGKPRTMSWLSRMAKARRVTYSIIGVFVIVYLLILLETTGIAS